MSAESTAAPKGDSWVLYELTDRYLDDLERGAARDVEAYVALYPGHEDAIRGEYAELAAAHGTRRDGRARGSTRVGPYRLLSELGRGGQARVWLAEDTRLSRKVALKVLGATLVEASQKRRDRFRREAELVARLEHPGICGVLEADLEAELPWIAMRYVEGETLAASLERERVEHELAGEGAHHPVRGAHLAERLSFFERVARALHAAHEAGVVHRDVKPGNVMVASDGAPVVLDFGLAYDEGEQSDLTRTGEVFGTPAYMAPEQLDGRTSDRRTDVYALGVVVYEAVTLRKPFAGASSEALARAIRTEIPTSALALNPALPRDLDVVLATALEKEPARRYATALELAEELRRVREFEPIVARPIGPIGRLARWARRHPAVAAATVGSIALLSLALVAALFFIDELRDQRNAKEKALGEKQAALELCEGGWFRDASAARREIDPAESLRLAIAAAERDPGLGSNRALLAALEDLRERSTLSGHTGVIQQLDASSANGCVATCSVDGTARVWDAARGTELAVLRGHSATVWCVRFDRAGERVVTSSADGTARIWSWRDRDAQPVVLTGHAGEVEWAEFSVDGEHVVTSSRDKSARIWNARTGALEHELAGHAGNVCMARFFAGDRYVVTASGEPPSGSSKPESDNVVRVYDAATGERVASSAEHVDSIRRIELHPDGRRFVTTSDDATARLWDVAKAHDGALASTRTFRLPGRVPAASISPDGKRIAIAFDAGARVADLESGATLYELPDHDHRALTDIAFDPHGRYLATAAFDNTVRVFDSASPAQLALCRGSPKRLRGVVWGSEGAWLASWDTSPQAKVWYGPVRPFLAVLDPHAGKLETARYDPTGRRVVTACADGRAALFDVASGALLERFDPEPSRGNDARSPLVSADFDAEGARILATSAAGTVSVLDVAKHALERSFAGLAANAPPAVFLACGDRSRACRVLHVAASGEPAIEELDTGRTIVLRGARGQVIALRASLDGAWVACGTDQRTVHAWHVAEPRELGGETLDPAWTFGPYAEANHKLNSVYEVAFSPDGRRVAAATQNLHLYLFDARTGDVLKQDSLATVGNLAFTHDGRYLFATGRWSSFVRAYRVDTASDAGKLEVRELREIRSWQRNGSFRALASAPDRNLVVAGSLDHTATMWDLDAAECVAIEFGHGDALWDVDFAPDGKSFVTASGDGTARIWPVDLLATARAALPVDSAPAQPLTRPVPRPR